MRGNFPMFHEIVAAYDVAMAGMTPEIRGQAESWYCDANNFAHSLCNVRTDWSLETAACVISALSPRERWEANKAKAMLFAMRQPIRGLSANYLRAMQAEKLGLAALRGCKTNAFARAIMGDSSAVVIDTWMLKAINRRTVTEKQYSTCELAVDAVARKYGMTSRDCQAAIWIVTRGSHK